MSLLIEILIFFGVVGSIIWNWIKDTSNIVSSGVKDRLQELENQRRISTVTTYTVKDLCKNGVYICETRMLGPGNKFINISVVFCIENNYCYRFYINEALANLRPYMMNIKTCLNMVKSGSVTDDTLKKLSGFGFITAERSGISFVISDAIENQPRAIRHYKIQIDGPYSFRATGDKLNNALFNFFPLDFNNMRDNLFE